ncbi:hypothetical protein [Streptomyces aureus]|uniref:hypothetical protein n=1 Tax=Streptomyces aureus TaxID=193461 RepID=UPI00131A817F|nr:hypothetical protein [Streptomyces aureus]
MCLASALSGVIALTVAGCSPELRTLAAVYVDEQGTAHALLRSCDDGRVRGPGLRGTAARATEAGAEATEEEPAEQGTASEGTRREEPWIGWDTRGVRAAADFPLFAPPAEWAAEVRGPQTLRPGYSYELDFADPDDSYAYRASVTFDAGQLAALPVGEVLTDRGAMTREAFEDVAREAC